MFKSKDHLPLVKLSVLKPFCEALNSQGVDWQSMIDEFGFTDELAASSGHVFVPAIPALDLFLERAAIASDDVYFAAKVARKIELCDLPSFADSGCTASSLGELLIQLSRNARQLTTTMSVKLIVSNNSAKLCLERTYQPRFKPRQKDAFTITCLVRLLRYVTGTAADDHLITISAGDTGALPVDFCNARVTKSDSHRIHIEFPSSWLLMTLPADFVIPAPTDSQQAAPSGFLESLRYVLAECADMQKLDSDYIVAFTDHSLQSVQIMLRELNTSLSEEIMRAKMDRAVAKLTAGMSVTETASECGYKNATSFSRAFKGWFGFSPKDHRKDFAQSLLIEPRLRNGTSGV